MFETNKCKYTFELVSSTQPSSDLDILKCSLKHRMEHLVGKVGHFAHQTLQTKLGPMMDFGLIPTTEGVGDDGPYFAIVEMSLEMVELDMDP